MLLYNLTADISESTDVAAKHPDVVNSVTARMEQEHNESVTWPSVKDSSKKCCASCFNPKGCKAPCARMGPTPAPTPGPTPSPPFDAQELTGTWDANDQAGHVHFGVTITGNAISISNIDDSTSCWKNGSGTIDLNTGIITAVAVGDKCTRHATGSVKRTRTKVTVDQDYSYLATIHTISWRTSEGNGWPLWQLSSGLQVDMGALNAAVTLV